MAARSSALANIPFREREVCTPLRHGAQGGLSANLPLDEEAPFSVLGSALRPDNFRCDALGDQELVNNTFCDNPRMNEGSCCSTPRIPFGGRSSWSWSRGCLSAAKSPGLGFVIALLIGLSVFTWYSTHRMGLLRVQDREKQVQLWIVSSQIAMGACTELGWLPIPNSEACEAAAVELGLPDHTASLTVEADRPEGCYYFENKDDGTYTLWFSTNSKNQGLGAKDADGGRWEPICFAPATPSPTTAAVTETTTVASNGLFLAAMDDVVGFRKISNGTCADVGRLPVHSVSACEAAAAYFGLSDTSVTVTSAPDRPEGCYYFRNLQDHTATLWMGTCPDNIRRGARMTDVWMREPICMPTSTVSGFNPTPVKASSFEEVSSGSCVEVGMLPVLTLSDCETAASELGLGDISAALTHSLGRPEGCYLLRPKDAVPTLWLSNNLANQGRGALRPEEGELQMPICRSFAPTA